MSSGDLRCSGCTMGTECDSILYNQCSTEEFSFYSNVRNKHKLEDIDSRTCYNCLFTGDCATETSSPATTFCVGWKPCKPVASEDMVNSPPHYNNYNTEVIDVLRACLTDEQYKGYLLGNMLKYRLRAGFKDDKSLDRDDKRTEDLKKSNWYQDKL